jgi:hypothetical protein
MTGCVFCGGDLSTAPSEEHIFPQWLLKHLGIPKTDQMFQGVGLAATNEIGEAVRIHGTWRFVEGRVCEPCNNGWMVALESKARPILKDLIDGERSVLTLTPEERATVTKWRAKTALLVANVSPFRHPAPAEHLRSLNGNDGIVPSGLSVFACLSKSPTQSSYLQSNHWTQIYSSRSGYVVGSLLDAYKIGIQFNYLFLLAAYWPDRNAVFATAAGLHVPMNQELKLWPSYFPTPPDGPEGHPLWTFTRSLAVVIR